MGQNYQQKYQQLKLVCRRQEGTIAKLQLEIRERCQSYLLHSSKHKKQNLPNVDNSPQLQPSLPHQDSVKTKSVKSVGESEHQKESFFELKARKELQISNQVDLMISEQQEKFIFAAEDRAALIESFKERISILQGNKNELVRQLQKQGKVNYELDLKVKNLQRELQLARKGEKKAKDKLKKLPQYQQKLNQIYTNLISQAREQQKQAEGDKQLHQTLDEIIAWIQRAKANLQIARQEFNLTEVKTEQKIAAEASEKILTSEFSPMKNSQRRVDAGWTIISKLNEIDIVPQSSSKKGEEQSEDALYQSEIEMLQEHNSMFEEELRQSKVELYDVREEAIRSRAKITSLLHLLEQGRTQRQQRQAKFKEQIVNIQGQLSNSQKVNQEVKGRLQSTLMQLDSIKSQLQKEKQSRQKYQQQLAISRIKGSQLQQSKLLSEIDSLKQSLQRTNLNQSVNSCEGKAQQIELEQPYYVEEDLKLEGTSQYVKRSFIRKKIVRRNLSATAYRIVSKSREEVDQIVSNKLSDYRDKSKEKASRRKQQDKKQKLQAKQQLDGALQRVSEVSEPRDSGINTECDVVKVIEVTTRSGGDQVRTAKVYEKGYESQLSTKRRY